MTPVRVLSRPGRHGVIGTLAAVTAVSAYGGAGGLVTGVLATDSTLDSRAAVVVGALLIGWIGVELAFIRELTFFHPIYAAIGVVFVSAGVAARGL